MDWIVPPHIQAKVQRILDREASRRLALRTCHAAELAEPHGGYRAGTNGEVVGRADKTLTIDVGGNVLRDVPKSKLLPL